MTIPPLPEHFGNFVLKGFVEVSTAPTISWIPQTVGWYVLGLVLLGFALRLLGRQLRRWYSNRYRREALRSLTTMASNNVVTIENLNQLLKRVSLAAFPREQVAQLSGQAWIEFLSQQCDELIFSPQQLSELGKGGYQRQNHSADLTDLRTATGRWITLHRGPEHA